MQSISRRRFIQTTAAGAAGLWVATNIGTRWVSASTKDPEAFPFGVASGDPRSDAVIIWTHVAPESDEPVDVAWEVATDPSFGSGSILRSGIFATDGSRDHTVKVDVQNLDPGTTYWYRFHALGQTSRTGRTRTAPDGPTAALAFALASCQNFTHGYYAAWRHIAAREDLDFVLHVGDYMYEGGGSAVRAHYPARQTVTLEDYRLRYRNYHSDPDLRDARAAHPFICIWDDHEVANNNYIDGAENHDPETQGDYITRRNNAFQAYEEWIPIRIDHRYDDGGIRIYRDLTFGDLVDLFMIDTRQYRHAETENPLPVPAPQTNPGNADPDRTKLGADQLAWLKDGLAASEAQWRVIGNQTFFAQFTYGPWPDEVSGPFGELIGMPADGFTVNPDQWDGYQPEQREILEHLRDAGISNTIICSGDIHMSFANEVYVDAGRFRIEEPVAAEFVGPSISSNNFDEALGWPPRTGSLGFEALIKAGNPHIRYAELDSNGYVVARVTPEQVVGEWWHLSDVRDVNATESLATAWSVRNGDLTLDWTGGQPVAT